MQALIDTHTFFWFVFNDAQLSEAARTFLEDPTNKLFVSIASIWEASIKAGAGKLTLGPDVVTFFETKARASDINLPDRTEAPSSALGPPAASSRSF